MFGKINPLAFALALGVGLMIVYITAPRPRVVLSFPSPINAGNTVYRHDTRGCYVYESEPVPCDESAKMPPVASDADVDSPVISASVTA